MSTVILLDDILKRDITVKQYSCNTYKPWKTFLYMLAVIFVIAWAIGFFVYSLGALIHILLVLAVIAILLRLIRGGGTVD